MPLQIYLAERKVHIDQIFENVNESLKKNGRCMVVVSEGLQIEGLPILTTARAALSQHYARPFDSIGFNLYRDGHDSVAWHSDRERYELEDPTVAIVSTGQSRAFHVRPRGGGASRSWQLGHGDLFVMGGSCQHDWEHCGPKVAVAGPRLSIMFRHNLADAVVRD